MAISEVQSIDELLDNLFNQNNAVLTRSYDYTNYCVTDPEEIIKELYLISSGDNSGDEYHKANARILKLSPISEGIIKKFAENVRNANNSLLLAEYLTICSLIKANLLACIYSENRGDKKQGINQEEMKEILTQNPIKIVRKYLWMIEDYMNEFVFHRNKRYVQDFRKRKEELLNNVAVPN